MGIWSRIKSKFKRKKKEKPTARPKRDYKGPVRQGRDEKTFRKTGRSLGVSSQYNEPSKRSRGGGSGKKKDMFRAVSHPEEFKTGPSSQENIAGGVLPITPGDITTITPLGVGGFALKAGLKGGTKIASKELTSINIISKIGKPGTVQSLAKSWVNVNKIAKAQGLTEAQTAALAKEMGRRRIAEVADKIVGSRYANNLKSQKLTTGLLVKRGLQGAAVSFIVGAFGTYPFAAWAKQEVLSGLKINARDARESGDFEMAERMIELRKEVAADSWWLDLPYKNLIEEFQFFFRADKLAIESEERLIAHARGELEFEGKSTGEQIAERDVAQEQKFKEIETSKKEEETEEEEKWEKRKKESERKEAEDRAYYTKLREESDKRTKQNTLFYEAIRKRNAGIKLSEEEIAILEERGASRDTYARGGRSTVRF